MAATSAADNCRDASGVTVCLKVILVIVSLVYLFNFAAWGLIRAGHPYFDNDDRWQGAQLIAAVRLVEGKALYPDYDAEGAYYCYAPLVPALQALALRFVPVSLANFKAIALVACFVALAGVAAGAWEFTRSVIASLAAAAIFAGTCRFADSWHYNVRPDVFVTAFCTWAFVFAHRQTRNPERILSAVAAAALFAFAALSKQNFLLPAAVYLLFLGARSGLKAVLWPLVAVAIVFAVGVWAFSTGGEHLLDSLLLMGKMPMKAPWEFVELVSVDFTLIAIPLAMSLAALCCAGARPAGARILAALMYLSAFALGILPYMKEGGCTNSFLFFSAMAALLAADAAWSSGDSARRPSRAMLVVAIVFLAIESAFSFTFYIEKPLVPYIQPAMRFVERNRGAKIYFPRRNYVTFLASGQYYPDDNMTWDHDLADLPEPRVVVEMVEKGYFDYIIGDFHSGKLNSLRDARYEPLESEPLGEFVAYARRANGP